MDSINLILNVLTFLLLLPVSVLVVQVLSAIILALHAAPQISEDINSRITVLIPAHNESVNIIPTLDSLKHQTIRNLHVLVVADNCEDDTALVARTAGVTVIERFDHNLRGKGYALDYGVRHLAKMGAPDYVVIVDADCVLDYNAITALISMAKQKDHPVQACYLMRAPVQSSIKTKVAEFAWLLKNFVRPLGFMKLGLPCQLTGSGMAFSWSLISKVNFASGHIVEDMKMGLDFAEIGYAPLFCPSAVVYSDFPVNDEGIKTQRTRWEHGHLGIIVKDVPSVLWKGITHKNFNLFAMGIDLIVPPLSLMAIMLMSWLMVGLGLTLISSAFVSLLINAVAVFVIFVLAIMLFWLVYGRKIISLGQLLSIPYYIVMKLPIYVKFIVHRQSEWVRSKRDE